MDDTESIHQKNTKDLKFTIRGDFNKFALPPAA
jgi:hypothetical protein